MSLTLTGCFENSEGEPYYGHVTAPQAQEFRWSDGGLPQTFDPALAAAPPDTDAVRALFEGLTDYDPDTLAPVPGVATRWESSADGREWTFYLRPDARWSNGDLVTANDFVRSWQRTIGLGSRAPHSRLLENVIGTVQPLPAKETERTAGDAQQESPGKTERSMGSRSKKKDQNAAADRFVFGAEAVSDTVLRVRLERPDRDFASLVAHPIFRPIHGARNDNAGDTLRQPIVSNGPFKLTQVAGDGVILERAGSYWDAKTVVLDRVRFIATNNAEEALEKYRTGEVDVVTNAGFQPLALKLLAPYKDFRRATFGALTYYKFNTDHTPFGDVRVREALTIAIDRERISDDEMDGASEPANSFFPAGSSETDNTTHDVAGSLSKDVARAQRLLAEAGYQNGLGFPVIKLLVNRNDQQRQIAQSIAAMWRRSLGIETEIVVKSWEDYEEVLRNGDYDVVRKGIVMQTMDEAANMRAMFEDDAGQENRVEQGNSTEDPGATTANAANENPTDKKTNEGQTSRPSIRQPILTHAEALKQLPAMPIYFASSYSLVRPYVIGFHNNLLDAPSLKRVRLDTTWKAPKKNTSAWFGFSK
jgi:oligopeptide transport system substrate-binding protein